MRIGIDARELTGQPTGVGRVLSGLLAAWPPDDELILYARSEVPWRFIRPGWRSRVHAGPRGLPGALWEQALLPRFLRRDRVAALFSPAYGMPAHAPCGVVVGMHDCAWEATPEEFGMRERWRRRWAARSAARRAAYLLVGSRFSAREIQRWYGVPPGKIVKVDYAADPSFGNVDETATAGARERYGITGRSVLFVGAPLRRRNLGTLIEAVGTLRSGRPDVALYIVGPERRGAAQLRAPSGNGATDDGVRWLGYVPDADLPALYAAATVAAYPSSYEGFGFPVLEALACGTPVVASRSGSLGEIFASRAVLVDQDVAAWTDALAGLLDDPEARREWSHDSGIWARRRGWGPAARLLRRLLADAATHERPGPP